MTDILNQMAAAEPHEEPLRCLCGCGATPRAGGRFVAQSCFARWAWDDRTPPLPAPPPPLPELDRRIAEYARERVEAERRRLEHPRCGADGRALPDPDAEPVRPPWTEDEAGVRRPVVSIAETARTIAEEQAAEDRATERLRQAIADAEQPAAPSSPAPRVEATDGPASGPKEDHPWWRFWR